MKETGIIMSGSHPKDIIEGRKTMTRRVIKPNLEAKLCKNSDIVRYCNTIYKDTFMFECWHPANNKTPLPLMIRCPYGQVGDRLWVRETWGYFGNRQFLNGRILYKADVATNMQIERWVDRWHSSRFMFRKYSRILLEITEIRVERLQEISGQDIKSEGLDVQFTIAGAFDALDRYQILWDSLNDKRGYSWDKNPWVWVISFRLALQSEK